MGFAGGLYTLCARKSSGTSDASLEAPLPQPPPGICASEAEGLVVLGEVPGGPALAVSGARVGPALESPQDSVGGDDVEATVCPGLMQQQQGPGVVEDVLPVRSRPVQGGRAVLIPSIHVGPNSHQCCDNGGVGVVAGRKGVVSPGFRAFTLDQASRQALTS